MKADQEPINRRDLRAIRPLMASTVSFDVVPRATSGWLVTTIRMKAAILQSLKLLAKAAVDFDFLHPRWGKRFALAYDGRFSTPSRSRKIARDFIWLALAVPTVDSHFV